MIEMLGVLAIVAVLSIGGLLGYRYAVNVYKANAIFDNVNRFEFVLSERNDHTPQGEKINPGDFKAFSGFEIEAFNEPEDQRHYRGRLPESVWVGEQLGVVFTRLRLY